MATPFHVEVVTPERILYSGESDEVSMRTDSGEIAFLANHEDFIGAMDITLVRIHAPSTSGEPGSGDGESSELRAAVHGGFVNVDENGVAIYAGIAELGAEIDVERARNALAAAESRVGQGDSASTPIPAGENEGGALASGELHGAMLALLAPDSAEAAAQRARVRLEAAGATQTT